MVPENTVLIIIEDIAYSQLHPILKNSNWDWGQGLSVIRRMYVIMCVNFMWSAKNLGVQMEIHGYK